MKWTQLTNTGLVRPLNEDSLCVAPGLGLYAVADGMGGHVAGEIASKTALDVLQLELARKLQKGEPPEEALVSAVQMANTKIYELGRSNQQWSGMGTTVTACLKSDGLVYLAQVGDSRAYLLRQNLLTQLTEDHSLVYDLIRSGELTEDQARKHPQRNVLTRALGTSPSVTVDFFRQEVVRADLLLLCTDGLTGYLKADEILQILTTTPDLDTAAGTLVNRALNYGGRDNVTVVLLEI